MTAHHEIKKLALAISDAAKAQQAAQILQHAHDWVSLEEADAVVTLGGDGFMLTTLHHMLDHGPIIPVYGINRGTFGFLMNKFQPEEDLLSLVNNARHFTINPLRMEARTRDGRCHVEHAINEVSLLRETRQTAKLEVTVGDKVRIEELVGDGILIATPAGSTAYNFSANGPILPLDSRQLALTPISPFRPRRWRGAILPDRSRITIRVNEPEKRPVAAVADQIEIREIAEVNVAINKELALTLLFDPGHSLDERIVAEQFIT